MTSTQDAPAGDAAGADPHGISYSTAASYWSDVAPTVDGMLGGFGKISSPDIDGSAKFLKGLFKLDRGPGKTQALDCGAGIGRITKHLLQRHFQKIDLVEQNPKFLEKAKSDLAGSKHVGEMFCSGLQDFTPAEGFYDVIWCQWVLGHLTDQHLVQFFKRCVKGLKPNGLLVVKENLTSSGEVEKDDEDSSVTRPEAVLRRIFAEAGLKVSRDVQQQKFPRELYPVKMFALAPEGRRALGNDDDDDEEEEEES